MTKNIDVPAVDTSSCKRFPNAKAFLADFRGGQPFFQRHLQLLSQMHGEICGFCSKSETVENMLDLPQDVIDTDVVFLEHGICPRCQRTRLQNLQARHWPAPTQIQLSVGLRGGKAVLAALAVLYAEHLMLTLPHQLTPAQYFDLTEPKELQHYFRNSLVAISGSEATSNFQYIKILRRASRWFINYRGVLDNESMRLGLELYSETSTSLAYHHTKMLTVSEIADARLLRGPTRYFATSNDLTWCTLNDKPHGPAVYTSIENSLKTMRLASDKRICHILRMDGLKSFGFPCDHDVTLAGQHLFTATRYSRSDMFADMKVRNCLDNRVFLREYATWEFNPLWKRESLMEEFVKGPVSAERDFAAYKFE